MLDHSHYQATEESEGLSFSFGRIVNALRRRWWVIAAVVGLVAMVAGGFLATLPNRYSAVALVQIEPRDKKIAPVASVIPGLKGDTVTIESEVEALRSRTLLLKVIDKLDLRNDPSFIGPSALQKLFVSLGLTAAPAATSTPRETAARPSDNERDWVLASVQASLDVRRVRNTLVMAIEYYATSPRKAMKIANAIADTYIRSQLEAKEDAQRQVSQLLGKRVAALADKLGRAEARLGAFMSKNNIYVAEGHELVERQLRQEMQGLVNAQDEASKARVRYEKAQQMMRDGVDVQSVSDVLNSHTVRVLLDGLVRAERRMAEARTRLGPKHPEMAKIRADLTLARRALRQEVAKIVVNLRQERDIAAAREKSLNERLDRLKAQIRNGKAHEVTLRQLKRDVDATRELYQALLARSKQTAATADLQYSDAELLEHAGLPLAPIGPKRKQLLIIAMFLALGASMAGVVVFDLMEKGFAEPAEIEKVLQHEALAAFPEWPGGSDTARDVWQGVRQVSESPMSAIAESTRQLRHELDRDAGGDTRRVVMIASALAEEGRSHVATSLAYSYAASGKATLLIDGDLRFGHLSRALGLGGRAGLINALAGETGTFDTILSETSSGLSFMPAMARRRPDLAAPELLAGSRLRQLIDELKSEFDVIVLDAPALLPIVDGRAMATAADQITFVTTWRRTPKVLARRALETLGEDEDKVVGIVVNKIETSEFKRLFNYRGGWGDAADETAA